MKLFYKILPIFFVLISFSFMEPEINAQKFEGEILFKNKSGQTVNYTRYFVKGKMIRVERLNKKQELISYYIIDTETNELYFVNPHRKIYKHEKFIGGIERGKNQEFKINRTGNFKNIKGTKCFQWTVLNKEKETKVTYWLAESGVNSFGDVMEILNSTEHTSYYYLKIPKSNSNNIFPLEIEEFSLKRERRLTITLQKMKKVKIKAHFFSVPENFKSVD